MKITPVEVDDIRTGTITMVEVSDVRVGTITPVEVSDIRVGKITPVEVDDVRAAKNNNSGRDWRAAAIFEKICCKTIRNENRTNSNIVQKTTKLGTVEVKW